jgi:hypothetical protein
MTCYLFKISNRLAKWVLSNVVYCSCKKDKTKNNVTDFVRLKFLRRCV